MLLELLPERLESFGDSGKEGVHPSEIYDPMREKSREREKEVSEERAREKREREKKDATERTFRFVVIKQVLELLPKQLRVGSNENVLAGADELLIRTSREENKTRRRSARVISFPPPPFLQQIGPKGVSFDSPTS